jgi:hypothetical protein
MSRRDLVAERHGSSASSGADSFKSTDTVRNIFGSQKRQRLGVNVQTKDDERYVHLDLPFVLLSGVRDWTERKNNGKLLRCHVLPVSRIYMLAWCFALGAFMLYSLKHYAQQPICLWKFSLRSERSRCCIVITATAQNDSASSTTTQTQSAY